MPFDQSTRNRLSRFVGEARIQLTEECTRQLQRIYGIDPASGEVAPLDRLTGISDEERQTAELLRETAEHYQPGFARLTPKARRETIERIVREQAFTVLNRLCALRMAEARGLLIESVGAGYQSKGFQLYMRLAGPGLGETGEAYRWYLFSLFDEFALDLPVLFDRFSPQGRLFPGETALRALLDLINHPEIEPLWAEDETIGWIYQYFNSKEERKAMREASSAPRNSRELAVRNQFFTPRYVVEFLTDNTLGRIWYEMTKGQTGLMDHCRYLVRRPTEIFLDPGEQAPAQPESTEQLSQEELLRQPVYIPHRPLKDPRALRMLDPACGSMHFGLYAFDLFEQIYAEAWDLEEAHGTQALERAPMDMPLHDTYPTREVLLRDVPRLIIERNIHGVDIDPRAVQIAGLSLWLRAQKSWREQGLKSQERPQIRRSNVVCAEPMPGDQDLLEEFIAQHLSITPEDKIVSWMLRRVFAAMTLAGEAGTLLKIEEEIGAIIAEAKHQWQQGPKFTQSHLFAEGNDQLSQQQFDLDTSGLTDATFWLRVEQHIESALHDYAAFAEGNGAYRRRLFAGDAARGFAFVDLFRKRYDFVLMNPPFGEEISSTRSYLSRFYPIASKELATCFVQRGAIATDRLGLVGAITSRFMLANDGLSNWRKNEFLGDKWSVHLFTDLGYNVLDDAMVEACAYVSGIKEINTPIVFINCLDEIEKSDALSSSIVSINENPDRRLILRTINSFRRVPDYIICYWLPQDLLLSVLELENIQMQKSSARVGLQTGENTRFTRATWEVDARQIGKDKTWCFFAKGGEYEPYYDDIHLVVFWKKNGQIIKNFTSSEGKLLSRPQNLEYYFQEGITYPDRTTSDFSPRVMPKGIIFSSTGFAIFPNSRQNILGYLGAAYTRPFKILLEAFVGSGDSSVSGSAARHYRPGILNLLPNLLVNPETELQNIILESIHIRMREFEIDETARYFSTFSNKISSKSLLKIAKDMFLRHIRDTNNLIKMNFEIERFVIFRLNIKNKDFVLNELYGRHPALFPKNAQDATIDEIIELLNISEEELIVKLSREDGAGRTVVKKSYFANRRIELVCRIFQVHPEVIVEAVLLRHFAPISYIRELANSLLSLVTGCVLGRWDIRYATDERPAPEPPNPFAPLPICPPGMLQNAQGLPAAPEDVPVSYPLRISWPGILVDDEGHIEDIVGRVREAILVIWGTRANAIEQEACEILGVRTLREYFRKPGLFFADHLQRYSKSRRQAPIYWSLSTPSGSYTLWLYYHRLTDQTLYSCVNDFVEPRLTQLAEQTASLRRKSGRSTREEQELERLTDLEQELRGFRDELLRVAAFWKPNLNDGVQITAAPLWRLFQHKPWQKRLKETWEKLEQGEYDWAHLAYSIWPARVRDKCRTDKSLAIAHDLEDLYVEPSPSAKKKRGRPKREEIEDEED